MGEKKHSVTTSSETLVTTRARRPGALVHLCFRFLLQKLQRFLLFCFRQRDHLDEDCITELAVHHGVTKDEMKTKVSKVTATCACPYRIHPRITRGP